MARRSTEINRERAFEVFGRVPVNQRVDFNKINRFISACEDAYRSTTYLGLGSKEPTTILTKNWQSRWMDKGEGAIF